jgi:DNA-binding MarR family transcriptional regulator
MRWLVESRPITSGDWELTVAQVRARGVVADRADCTMGDLARSLGTSLGAATELVDRLVQHRLIERASDPKDRRVVIVRPARAAKRAREVFLKERRRQMEAALAGLSTHELEQIAGGFALLRKALGGKGVPLEETEERA